MKISVLTLLVAVVMLVGCASWQPPPAVDLDGFRARATEAESERVTARGLVLNRQDMQNVLGEDLHSHDIEPVWLEVYNGSDQQLYLLQTGSDPDYFSAHEVAWSLHGRYSRKSRDAIDQHLQAVAFPRGAIAPGETRSGLIFTNPHLNVKLLNVDLFGRHRFISLTMFLPIPDEQGNLRELSDLRFLDADVPDYQSERELMLGLRTLFHPGGEMGMDELSSPVNLVWVGHREDIATALVRRGYRWESFGGDTGEHLFDRAPLSVMRKWGQAGVPENWIRFWELPMHFQGRSVFVAQTAAPRGGRFASRLLAPERDPAVDQARDLLVQDMLFSGGLAKLSILHYPEIPTKFKKVSDGRVAVFFIASHPLDLDDIQLVDWRDVDWSSEPDPFTRDP